MTRRMAALAVMLSAMLVAIGLLVACGTYDVKPIAGKNDLSKVHGLEDCKVWSGWVDGLRTVIIRCPNSSTTTMHQQGKTTQAMVVAETGGSLRRLQ